MLDLTDIVQRSAAILRQKTKYTFVAPMSPFPQRKNCVRDTLSPKLAPAEDVRGALALVERNEAPLGIVYGSDAVASKGVKVVATFPEDSHKKVEYPVAVVEGHNNATVKAFYDYLKGPQAAEIFKRYGFTIK